MVTPSEHWSKALHNERFIDVHKLADGEFAGWAVTVLFYSALHWLRALAAQEGFQIERYRGKNSEERAFQQVPLLQESPRLYECYRALKDESQQARYEMKGFSSADFYRLSEDCYEPFKSFVTSNIRL